MRLILVQDNDLSKDIASSDVSVKTKLPLDLASGMNHITLPFEMKDQGGAILTNFIFSMDHEIAKLGLFLASAKVVGATVDAVILNMNTELVELGEGTPVLKGVAYEAVVLRKLSSSAAVAVSAPAAPKKRPRGRR